MTYFTVMFVVLFSYSRPSIPRSVLLAIVVVAIYTLLVGASVVRAAIMSIICSLALIAGRFGRGSWGLNTLAAATLGILLYGERFQALVEVWAAPFTTARWGCRQL